MGDRPRDIREAVAAIEMVLGVSAEVSSPYYSAPWGYDSPNEFVNMGMTVEVGDMTASELLDVLLMVQERIGSGEAHRTASGAYADRTIDVDLIALGDTVADTPRLTLPHRHMAERLFVLVPMAELWPGWVHPLTGLTPKQMIEAIGE